MPIPATMIAIVTTGQGGLDKLERQVVPTPTPGPDEVLVQVLAAGVNNTEVNTRLGWYSTAVDADTERLAAEGQEFQADGGWNEQTPFPFIQGTDCCGRVVAGDDALRGKRVLVRPCQRGPDGFASWQTSWMASDFDGAFAQFVAVRAAEVFPIDSDWTDVELASIPCAYGTAEAMIGRARVSEGDRVLVPGASGGVGSAVVQLAKRRGAHVTALCGAAKADRLRDVGADDVLSGRVGQPGWDALADRLRDSFDVVIDNVGGDAFPAMVDALERGGRYVTSGAIAGPDAALDLRSLYLRDLTLIGTTAWDEETFPNLIGYIERGEIKPLIAGTFGLEQIAEAQTQFLEKEHVGKYVLVPPPLEP